MYQHQLTKSFGGNHLQQVFIVNPDPVSSSITARTLASVQISSQEIHAPGELIKQLPVTSPSCFLIDLFLPDINGLQLMKQLQNHNCFQPCVFMSTKVDPKVMITAINRGAFGFINRPYQSLELIDMVQRALSFDQTLSPYISTALEYKKNRSLLSRREHEILSLLEIGKTAREVGMTLNLSRRTVENHKVRIFQKLNIKKNSQLIQQVTTLNLLRAYGTIK